MGRCWWGGKGDGGDASKGAAIWASEGALDRASKKPRRGATEEESEKKKRAKRGTDGCWTLFSRTGNLSVSIEALLRTGTALLIVRKLQFVLTVRSVEICSQRRCVRIAVDPIDAATSSTARIILCKLRYALSTTAVNVCNLGVRGGLSVKNAVDLIKSRNYDRYLFTNGVGCGFWIASVLSLLHQTQVNGEEVTTAA